MVKKEEEEVKIVTEIITKSAPENQNNAFMDTLNNIMNRLTELETKPDHEDILAGLIPQPKEPDNSYIQTEEL